MIIRYQFYYALIFLSTIFSWRMTRKYGVISFLLLAYCLISAVWDFQMPELVNDLLSLNIEFVAAQSFALIVMIVFFVAALETKFLPYLVRLFEIVLVGNCATYIYNTWGLFNAGSMDTAFIAMLYPFLVFRPLQERSKWKIAWRIILAIFPLTCLFVNVPGSTVFFGLTIGLGTYLILKKMWPLVLSSSALLMAIGYLMGPRSGGFLNDSGRFEPWKLFMTTWWNGANHWWGTGTATFQWLGPEIQNKTEGLFIFMHNDYLQVIFEQGFIGFALSGILTIMCLRKAIKVPWLFASCLSTMFVAFFQYPLRFFFSELFVLLLIRLCLDEDSLNVIVNP